MLTKEEIEDRFKKNLLNVNKRLAEYTEEAIERGILGGILVNILNGAMPQIQKYLEKKSGRELIEGFIYCSKSDGDLKEDENYKLRKFPEYWETLSNLPDLQEYNLEKNLKEEDCKPLDSQAENFFLEKLSIIFPITKPFQEIIKILYHYKDPNEKPFLSILDKKYIGLNFRAFPILAIKYINLCRNPKINDGKLVLSPSGKILYIGNNGYMSDISVKNSMIRFNLTHEDLLK